MQVKRFALGFAGGLLLVLTPAAYGADTPGEMAASSSPEAVTAPVDATAAAPADATVAPPAEAAPTSPQVAVETPAEARATTAEQQMATDPCAGSAASGSLDCEKLKRKVSTDKAGKAGMTAYAPRTWTRRAP